MEVTRSRFSGRRNSVGEGREVGVDCGVFGENREVYATSWLSAVGA